MKKIKKVSALILAMLILLLSVPTVSVFADTSDRYGRTKLASMEDGVKLQQIYDGLVASCAQNTPSRVDIDTDWGITLAQLDVTYKMFYRDYPEYFWINNGGYTYSSVPDGDNIKENNIVAGIAPTYIDTFTNLTKAKSDYNAKIASLTSDLAGKSEYEKAKILHDRLADTVTYQSTDKDQTSYGALVEGKAVCNGYARAYQHMLQEVGIDTWYVAGASKDPGSGSYILHAWNIVKIDNYWYYTDVTWDDQGDNLFYAYFNITTQQLKDDHVIGEFEGLLPNATATTANYFVKENRIFSSFDTNRLVSLLSNSELKTQIYVNYSFDKFAEDFGNKHGKIATALGISGQYSYSTSSLGKAIIIDFDGKVICNHQYTNACDNTCNLCGTTRTVINHNYNDCFANSTVNLSGSWPITVTGAGVYKITPKQGFTGNFSNHYIAVFDSDGNAIKYNEAKQGWPLIANQTYTVKLRNYTGDYSGITWNKSKISGTIFPDTNSADWYNDAVTYAVGRGIISGYGSGNFGPADSIQRQDFLVILARFDGVDLSQYTGKSRFADVQTGSYYAAAVNWGAEKGIVNGYQGGTVFGVSDVITREQLVTFLYRYASYKGIDVSYSNTTRTEAQRKYKDYSQVSDWSLDCVLWALENNVINGKNANTSSPTIAPQGNAQRCEVAQIMYNIFKNNVF